MHVTTRLESFFWATSFLFAFCFWMLFCEAWLTNNSVFWVLRQGQTKGQEIPANLNSQKFSASGGSKLKEKYRNPPLFTWDNVMYPKEDVAERLLSFHLLNIKSRHLHYVTTCYHDHFRLYIVQQLSVIWGMAWSVMCICICILMCEITVLQVITMVSKVRKNVN